MLERCGVVFYHKEAGVGGLSKLFSVDSLWGFAVPPCSGALSPLPCGAVFLERGCVSLRARVFHPRYTVFRYSRVIEHLRGIWLFACVVD